MYVHVDAVIHAQAVSLVDFSITNERGEVVRDTRAERLAEHGRFIASLRPKMANGVLSSMVDSYCTALDDPANEFVHLWELWDAADKHFGGDREARKALGVSRSDRRTFGTLCNDAALNQGRHRGMHEKLRDATPEELAEARRIAVAIIEAFAALL